MKLLTLFFLLFTGCILTHPAQSLAYANLGLGLWFQKMIPALLPFMILSGVMVRLDLTEKISMAVYPAVGPLYQVRRNVCYCMLLGFLCGFPMGARVAADLRERDRITAREGQFLLAFCNNIGPVYFCSFALPLLGRKLIFPYLFGMYGIPLLYGLLLRYTVYRDIASPPRKGRKLPGTGIPVRRASGPLRACEAPSGEKALCLRLLEAAEQSVQASVQGILTLGGYMILFNLMNLIPHVLLGRPLTVLGPLLEITGGLGMLDGQLPLFCLLALSFGGLSCIAQTYSCIRDTDLSLSVYVAHKAILTLAEGAYYLCWFLLRPETFLA